MKKLYLLALLALCFTSCSPYLPIPREYLTRETMCLLQTKATNEILREHEKYAREKYGLELSGDPEIRMNEKVCQVTVYFKSRRKVELDEARKIYLDVFCSLLNRFNNHPYYREYMEDYPFTEKNVRLQLGYYDENGSGYENPYIRVVSNRFEEANCIEFYRKEQRIKDEPYLKETFEEAGQKIKEAVR